MEASMSTETSELTPTVRLVRALRLGARRMTRAHVLLSGRSELAEQGAVLLNRACESLRTQLACPVDGTARLAASAGGPRLSSNAAFAVLELTDLGSHAVLEVELPFALAVIDRLSGGAGSGSPVTRLTRIEEAAFSFLVLRVLAAIREDALVARFKPHLASVTIDPERAAGVLVGGPCLAMDLALSVGGATGSARLIIPSSVAHGALIDARRVEGTLPEAIGGAAVAGAVRAGLCSLERASFDALSPGDVLVFERLHREQGRLAGAARIVAPTFELHGELVADGLSFTRALERAAPPEVLMSAPQNEVVSPPVDVEIELTRVRLQLSDLAGLRPGVVLPLRMAATDPVLLRVGDRVIARAELVDIEGEVGARILAFVP
jgi:type III secretion protein Q